MRHLLLVGMLLVFPTSVRAQSDWSSDGDASAAGQAAAEAKGVGGYFAASLVGGIPIGFFLPIAVYARGPVALTGLGMGTAAVGITTHKASVDAAIVDPAIFETLQFESTGYQEAFLEAYEEELSGRRVRSSLWGGAVGTGVGLGLLWWAVASIGDF